MAEFTISTNLISWVVAKVGLFGWPAEGAEAEVIDTMGLGDLLIPKFAQQPDYGGASQVEYVKAICAALRLDYEEEAADYEMRVDWGKRAAPFVWTVTGLPRQDGQFVNEMAWRLVSISQEEFRYPYSTSEFLRLRDLPIEIARQFKATTAPGRHIQLLPEGAGQRIRDLGDVRDRKERALRTMSLVKEPPITNLEAAGSPPRRGDFAFVVGDDRIPGLYEARVDGELTPRGERIEISPHELPDLIERARERATDADRFYASNARRAARELADLAASGKTSTEVPEFATFYDGYVLLPQKVSQALELAERPAPAIAPPPDESHEGEDEEESGEQAELDRLHGLTVSATEAHLSHLELHPSVLAEAVTALRAGKHLLLSGPPGTGKSTIASALCRAVVDDNFDVATATADWTTFETIGGYMPRPRGGGELEFEPGLVLRALQRGHWLVVDEINRADIDKAFGPLFTLLADSDGSGGGNDVVLPYRKGERSIRVVRSARREGAASPYAMTPIWRLIGTFNARDKATLFRLSFAFLRRFAIVEVPLPGEEPYRRIFSEWTAKLQDDVREPLTNAAMALAFGPRELGPAILKDIADFTNVGVVAADTASRVAPYQDPVVAFLTGVRLYAVPQYEGARKNESDLVLQEVAEFVPGHLEDPAWLALGRAFDDIVLP